MIDQEELDRVVRSNIEELCGRFFPHGQKVGSAWKIGDSTGARGESLNISLVPDRAGLWLDFATGEKGDFVQLLMKSRNLSFADAAAEIGRCLGIDLIDRQHAISSAFQQKEHSQNGASIDWSVCRKLNLAEEKRLVQWRGYTPSFVHWLTEAELIRTHGANGDARWVFPIHLNGKVAGTHSRLITWTGSGSCPWSVYPTNSQGGPGIQPLVLGKLEGALSAHLSESTWDTLAICDRLRLHETDGFCALCTRGAGNGKLASSVPSTVREVFLWEQNDHAGKTWSDAVVRFLPRATKAKVVYTPDQYEDPNDWTAKGNATAQQLVEAISAALPLEAKPKGDEAEILTEKPLRPMPSWIAYGNREIDRSQYHLGEGFLEIGGFVMLIGQSYAGKSTFIAQLSICLSIGREWLFFKLQRALRVLVVQAEDAINRLVKMGHMFKRMGLSVEEKRLADQNTAVLTIRDLQDKDAITEIERHARVFGPDIIVINPMTSYLGGSVYKEEAINAFLRVSLTPLLDRLAASSIVVHHPPKPITSDTQPKDLTAFELQYGSAGMAALTNASRGNMFLTHVHDDVFKLQVGKGFEDLGSAESIAYLCRSKDQDGVMLWERCDSEKAEEANQKEAKRKAKKRSDSFVPYERLLKCFSPTQKYPRTKIIELSKKELGKGRDWTDDALKQLVFDKTLAKTLTPNPKGQAFVFYHLPTPLEPAE